MLTVLMLTATDTHLYRQMLAIGGYSHLMPAPFTTSSSDSALLDPKPNRDRQHRFAAHHADFTLARGVNVGEGQRSVARGVVRGRLGVKA
jgi:hypothetical protein